MPEKRNSRDSADDGDSKEGQGADQSEKPDPELRLLQNAVAVLMEHFDAVQIFANRLTPDGQGTVSVMWGSGNVHARRGQVAQWLLREKQDIMKDR